MSELKPCPFCGGELYYTTVTDNPFSYDTYSAGHCSKCHATGPFVVESYLEDEAKPTCDYMKAAAKEKWQTRPIEDNLRKRVAELKVFIDQLIEAGNALETEAYDAWKKDGMLDFPAAETWLKLVHSRKEREE